MVKINAAVCRPQVGGDAQAVDVVSADAVPRGRDPGDYICGATTVVVEPPANHVLVIFPGANVELSDLRDHVCQRVGGGFVMDVGLVLVRIQLTTFKHDTVGVVFKHGLSILKALVKLF